MKKDNPLPLKGLIWDIQRYAIHDGPGIRTLIFLKGCPLRCVWCCNPEGQSGQPEILWFRENCNDCRLCLQACPKKAIEEDGQRNKLIHADRCDLCGICANQCPSEAIRIVGKWMTVDDVLEEVAKDDVFYRRSGGGITLTGGEPAAQPEFTLELLRQCKLSKSSLHTAFETCGYVSWPKLAPLLEYANLILFDIKHMDSAKHKQLTGVSNQRIFRNARRIAEQGKRMIVRLPLIPGYNDDRRNISLTAEFVRELPGVQDVHLLPYHRLGESKYTRLKRCYPLVGLESHSSGQLETLQKILERYEIRVKIGG